MRTKDPTGIGMSHEQKLLYCEQCGKRIPREEAERADYESIGMPPTCRKCLKQDAPERLEDLDTARSTRIMRGATELIRLKNADKPKQLFPAPGTELPPDQTSPEIRAIRDELRAEFKKEREAEQYEKYLEMKKREDAAKAEIAQTHAARQAKQAAAEGSTLRIETTAAAPSVEAPPEKIDTAAMPRINDRAGLPRSTRRALWMLLVLCVGVTIGLLAWWPSGQTPVTDAPAGPLKPSPPPALPPPVEKPAPALPPPTDPAPPPTDPAPALPEATPDAATRQMNEVETIVTLVGEKPTTDRAAQAVRRLKVIAAAGEEPARTTAAQWVQRYEEQIDARERQAARDAAEEARDLVRREQYNAAILKVKDAAAALNDASPWVRGTGRGQLKALADEWTAAKRGALQDRLDKIEKLSARGESDTAREQAEQLSRHPEPEFRAAATEALQKVAQAEQDRLAGEARRLEEARRAWPRFFRQYDQALAHGEYDEAKKLCVLEADSPLRNGPVPNPEQVLLGFGHEVDAIRDLYGAAITAATSQIGRSVDLVLDPGRIAGKLVGAKAKSIVLSIDGKAETEVDVERLAPEALALLLNLDQPKPRASHGPPLWTLQFARGELTAAGGDAEAALVERYRSIERGLPHHWTWRFKVTERERWRDALDLRLTALEAAAIGDDPDALREALQAAQAVASKHDDWLAAADRAALAGATKRVGRTAKRRMLFQNGSGPTTDYIGGMVDQINRYYRNEKRTDVDIRDGLKLGSFNDLQRVLLRFDGLKEGLGAAKVTIKKATLELYQIAAPAGARAQGATVALYRLKKPWVPDAGSWLNADQRGKVAWDQPGASGPADTVATPEAAVEIDRQVDVWRSFDLTQYVADTVSGKDLGHGLLIRIQHNEPQYHLRFYPDTDLRTKNEPTLRPRLIVEFEALEAPANE